MTSLRGEGLDQFFAACDGCKVDAIALHSYTCKWEWLKSHIDLYRKYNKPIWLTEFMCAEGGGIAKDQVRWHIPPIAHATERSAFALIARATDAVLPSPSPFF